VTLGHATLNITAAQSIGYFAALLVFVSFWMKTMIPLRLLGIASNVVFIVYGYLGAVYPPLILHLVLLPLNAARLREMMRLTQQVEQASKSDLNMDWIKPFSSTRHVKAGAVLFRKGEIAEEMFFVVSGRYLLVESGSEVTQGRVIGELGMVAPDKARTQTFQCVEGGDVLSISYDQVKQLYYQNPQFGFYFLQLTSKRLFENIAVLEGELARRPAALAQARPAGVQPAMA
jgi:CRP/FNR family transcriptional regulator, cyclic AMP receptor protein